MLLAVVLNLLLLRQCASINPHIPFLVDFLKSKTPVQTVAYLCWDYNDSKILLKELYKNMIPAMMLNSVRKSFPESTSAHLMVYILNLECRNSENLLLHANRTKILSKPYQWLLLGYYSPILETLNLPYDSNVILAEKRENEFVLMELYKQRESMNLLKIGGKNITDFPVSQRRKNMNGLTLTCVIVLTNNDTRNHLTDYRDTQFDAITKSNYATINHLFDYVNASGHFKTVSEYGKAGLFGALVRKETDIGGTPLFCLYERFYFMECLTMPVSTKGAFIFKQPPLAYMSNVFILPFSRYVWITVAVVTVITSFFLYGITKWEWSSTNGKQEVYAARQLEASLSDSIMFTLAAACQQGDPAEPKSLSGRIVVLSTIIALMFIFVSYSANIVVLFQSSSTKITSLQDLYDSGLILEATDLDYNRNYFPKMVDPPIKRKIYLNKIVPHGEPEHFVSLEEGFRRMRKGYFALFSELSTLYKLVRKTFQENEKCGLQEIKYLTVEDPWLTTPKNSSFKEIFRIGLLKIQESGLSQAQRKRVYVEKPVCQGRGGTFRSAGLREIYHAFLLLISGCICSMLILLGEYLLIRFENRVHFRLIH